MEEGEKEGALWDRGGELRAEGTEVLGVFEEGVLLGRHEGFAFGFEQEYKVWSRKVTWPVCVEGTSL